MKNTGFSGKMYELLMDCKAQALTEYLATTVFIGLIMAGVWVMLKWPIVKYLESMIEAITR